MKKYSYNKLLLILAICTSLMACEDENGGFPQAASLKVVHAVPGAPEVHVDYFGMESLNFSKNPTLNFGSNERYTLPVGVSRDIRFTYAADTTRQVLSQQVMLDPGQISTLFLLGDSSNLSTVMVEDLGLRSLRDSVNTVRFVNMSEETGTIRVELADESNVVAPGLAFANATDFMEVDATLENPSYTYTFIDSEDNVLASYTLEQFQVFIFPGFPPFVTVRTFQKNVTLALVGEADDGEGNNTLQVIRVDS